MARHEILRTVFLEVDKEPRQYVHPVGAFKLVAEPIHLTAGDVTERVNAIANQEAKAPFDLRNGPLIRVKLVKVNGAGRMLMVTMHHIIADGWSMQLLTSEFDALYHAFKSGHPSPLPPLPIQYKDFSEWQHAQAVAREEGYWLGKLTPLPDKLKLPYARRLDNADLFQGALRLFDIDQALSARLRQTAADHETTLSNTLLSAYALLLSKITTQYDIVIGIGHANRNHPDVQHLIGYFVNILPIRIEWDEEMSFKQLVDQVSRNCLDAYHHSNYPFDLMVEKLSDQRHAMRQSVVNVFYSYLNFEDAGIGGRPAARIEPEGDAPAPALLSNAAIEHTDAKFDLTFYVFDENRDGRLRFGFEYNARIFHPATIETFVTTTLAILPALAKELQEI